MKRFVATITAAALVVMLVISMTAFAGEKENKKEKRAKKPKATASPTASPTATPTTDPTEPPPPIVPDCADMRYATDNYTYNDATDSGLLTLDVEVSAPSCSDVAYRLIVLDGLEPGADVLADETVAGNEFERAGLGPDPGSHGFVSYVLPISDDDVEICFYSETLDQDGTLLDRAPNGGCAYVGPGQGSGGRSYN